MSHAMPDSAHVAAMFPDPASARAGGSIATRARRIAAAALTSLAALLPATAGAQAPAAALDVPYVPTPQHVVERMLEIAAVRPGEQVFDLGCGDGRMVVSAAEKFGARGFGVDLNPQRIEEANANAQRAGVADKVEFRVGDLFETDISQADVLAMYLLSEVNLRLRPKILETMKPGARVVSHAFNMGDWRPDRQETLDGRNIYLWVVPARVAGRWRVQDGERQVDLVLDQRYQDFSGTATLDGRPVPLREGRVTGAEISFVIEVAPGEARTYLGRVSGDRIEAVGTVTPGWQATRAAL